MYSLSLPSFSSQPGTPKCKTLLFKKQKKRKKLISPNSYIYAMLKAIHWTWPFLQFIERKWKEFRLCWAQKFWKVGGCLRFSVTKCNSNRWKPSAASAGTDSGPQVCEEVTGAQRAQLGAGPRTRGDTADLGLPAVPLGLQTLPVRELSREDEKPIMNGATGIKNSSLTSSYSLI